MSNVVIWLRNGLAKENRDVSGLAKTLKLHPSAIYKMIAEPPARKMLADEMIAASHYIREPIPGMWDAQQK